MNLRILGSSSSGNCYILEAKDEKLIIELGIHEKKIKQALNFNIRNVAALVSHSHGDHSKSLKEIVHSGIKTYALKETLEACGVTHYNGIEIRANITYEILGFKVKAFHVHHDVPCLGFLISHPESGLIMFLTDTNYTEYIFPGLNNIIIECNHDQERLAKMDNINLRNRIAQSHMNINTVKGILAANDLSKVNNIILTHLSDNNGNAVEYKREIEREFGKTVTVAEAGVNINFNKNPIC
jgi:phosphoribosyl 1,2-cyclic phosphodiesterase